MKLPKRIKHGLIYRLSRLGQHLASCLPLSGGVKLGKRLGGMAFHLLAQEREKTLHSLQLAWGDEKSPQELRQIARLSYQNLGKSFFELVGLPQLSAADLQGLVRLEGREHLEAALAGDKGVLCVTAHLGNWELLAAYIAKGLGVPVNVIARRVKNEGINRSLIDLRSQWGVKTILREKGFASQRLILKALARNELIGILMDQDTKVDGVFVDFFGRPAYTPVGPVRLAMATGAAILPMFIVRQPDDSHRVDILPVFELQLSADRERDILENTARLTQIVEEQIRRAPQQWVWMHQRWRRQPS